MLACNVVEEGEAILTEHVSKSTVVEVAGGGGKKVGIIGYVLQDTEWISSPGPTIRNAFNEFSVFDLLCKRSFFCKIISFCGVTYYIGLFNNYQT